jgi:predicted kinase
MHKDIYTLVGIAASGKSTYCTKLINEKDVISSWHNADTIREQLYGDASIQGDGRQVFDTLFGEYTAALKDDFTGLIIIDNTSLTYKLRKRYYQLANTICPMFDNTFAYHLVFFQPDLERSLKWNAGRDRKVPEDVIRSQFERYMGPSEKELEYANIIKVK